MINFVFGCFVCLFVCLFTCVLDGWNDVFAPLIILTYRVVDELLDLGCDMLMRHAIFLLIDFDCS